MTTGLAAVLNLGILLYICFAVMPSVQEVGRTLLVNRRLVERNGELLEENQIKMQELRRTLRR